GIVGMGRIGKALAERIAPFGANMLYSDPIRLASEQEKALSLAYSELPNLLKTADIISLHCPLTPETTGLISADSIALMKPSVIVVNVARGEVIDEAVVAAAIKQKKIGGLGIDVFTDEPPAPGSPLLGLGDENVILSPHVAGVTAESKMRIMSMSMNNLVKVMKGGEPENLVT
ncbi:MAG TPA: NAD(P)-dependent oxidoreductase, partial [Spirochaetota bacterium]|nr:NAD(P)-dependent oxidoreductase [Spirochaetota bacterium]